MYASPQFRIERAASLAFAEARGFGTICAWDGERPQASALPFCLDYAPDGTPLMSFHVARNNPLAALAASGSTWLMAVTGDDAYVSPDWYASPDQVPTWLYEAVHLGGPVRLMPPAELPAHLDALGAVFESWLAPKPPWTSAKMPPPRFDAMTRAIVGITMAVETVEGSLKLNQHKSDADHVAIATALAAQSDAASQRLARRMRTLRPHALDTTTATEIR